MADVEGGTPACATGSEYDGSLGLRIGAIFIIWASSTSATLFPILAKRTKRFSTPPIVFDFVKYFGSGVIIATAFIHLLAPAFDELGNECLGGTFADYDWAAGIALMSVFFIFLVEFFAFRMGSDYLRKRGLVADHQPAQVEATHTGHDHSISVGSSRVIDSQQTSLARDEKSSFLNESKESLPESMNDLGPAAQILGVAILEFGVIFHSVIIGLTLAVTAEFDVLFVVIIFHQMFEGLGLGSRLAFLPLPRSYNWVPVTGGLIYSVVTPLGMAIGLGIRNTYHPESRNALIVSGVLDAFSAGILLYTGLVELLAHEWLAHKKMLSAPMKEVLSGLLFVMLGAGIMALLGRWA